MSTSPAVKRLRMSEPDLKVILKFTNKNGEPQEKTYNEYSQNLATLSKFFDTALSVEMKEKETSEVVLHDVTPEIFEKALKFQQDHSAIRSMTHTDALVLLDFYDMYEFHGAIALCDDVISEYIDQETFEDLDPLIQVTVTAHRRNLKKSMILGTHYLKDYLEDGPLEAAMLSKERVASLVPLFKEKSEILPAGLTRKHVESDIFPEYFHQSMSCKFFSQPRNVKAATRLTRVEDPLGTRFSRNVIYKMNDKNGKWEKEEGTRQHIVKRGNDEDWIILGVPGDPKVIAWKCPDSKEFSVPPRGPWEPIHESVRGRCVLLLVEDDD